MSLQLMPITQSRARHFVARYHRHNAPPLVMVFAIGLSEDGALIGVATAGLPVARKLMDGTTLEVTRVCVKEGHRNANSILYGACARAASALGYARLVTYTLPEESGSSLRATGWERDEALRGHPDAKNAWRLSSRPRARDLFDDVIVIPTGPKVRWWKTL